MGLMTKIENLLARPFECIHNRKGFQPVDICRMAIRCIEQGTKKGINKTYASNRIVVRLSKNDYDEYKPFLSVISSDIKAELRRVIEERNYLLAGDLDIDIVRDNDLQPGLPKVEGFMQGEEEPRSVITGVGEGFENDRFENAEPRPEDTDDLRDEKTVIMLAHTPENKNREVSIIKNVIGRLRLDIPGVSLVAGEDGLYLENKTMNDRVTVNGRVFYEAFLSHKDEIKIGGLNLKYESKQDESA